MISLILAASIGQVYRNCQPVRVQQTYAYAPVQYQYVQQYAYPYVEKSAFVAVEPIYSALVGGEMRGALRLEESAAREKALADQIGRLGDEVALLRGTLARVNVPKGGDPNPLAPPSDPTPVVPAPMPPADPPPAPVDPQVKAIRDNAVAIMIVRCAKCHTTPVKNDGFVIFDSPGALRKMPAIDKLAIDHATYSGEMPQGGPVLSAEDYSALAAWVHADPGLPAAIKACRDKAAGKVTN